MGGILYKGSFSGVPNLYIRVLFSGVPNLYIMVLFSGVPNLYVRVFLIMFSIFLLGFSLLCSQSLH